MAGCLGFFILIGIVSLLSEYIGGWAGGLAFFLFIGLGFWADRKDKQNKSKEIKPTIIPDKIDTNIDGIQFWYTDFNGNLTKRNVRINSLDDEYLEAFDLDKREERTFRVERIDDEIVDLSTGELLSKVEWLNRNGIYTINKRGKVKELVEEYIEEICFTGFLKADREHLENLAEIHGYTVRKGVTKNLDYLVCGKNAGPSKIAQAESQGVIILEEKDFLELIGEDK
ncbi:hypothetical protein A6B39_05180 [Mannheimia granulomatis]|uniref:BRCT domain-containing protein n=1 Tax=Mannheimia TaxID=75984 RepID=UPI0013781245|nr:MULTISPECIES: BRCT domain-containing protein [Mannheimia]NBB66948.1 hypothetical protein [Mannheimia haemolytica]QLB14889.1 hypothetical protein A6B39_05180 [Mannheimia granulomatis]